MPLSPPTKPFPFQGLPSLPPPPHAPPSLLTWLILSIPQFSAAIAFPQRGLPSHLNCVLPVIPFHHPLCPLSHSSTLIAIYNFCSCSVYVFIPWVPHRCKCREVKNHFCFAHHCMPTSPSSAWIYCKNEGWWERQKNQKNMMGPDLEMKYFPFLFHWWLRCTMPYWEEY